MQTIKLRSLASLVSATILLTACPDDGGGSGATEATGSVDDGDDGATMQVTTMPMLTTTSMPPDPDTGSSDDGPPPDPDSTSDDGPPPADSSSTGEPPATDTGSSSTGEPGESSSSTGEPGESSTTAGDTGNLDACVDEDAGSTVPQTVSADTSLTDDTFIASCGMGANGNDYGVLFTAPMDGQYQIDTIGSAIDTILSIFDDCNGAKVACNDDGPGPELCNGWPCSQLLVDLVKGQQIIIQVDGFDESGPFSLNIDFAGDPPPPPPPFEGECNDAAIAGCTDEDTVACICEACDPSGACEGTEDCVCPDCAADAFCSNVANCVDDGLCDPYLEGCVCTDCAEHPSCG